MAKKKKIIEEEKIEEEIQEVEEVEEVVTSSEDEEEEEYVELTTEERIVNIEKKLNLVLVLVAIAAALALITMIILINNGSSNKATTDNSTTQEQQKSSASYDTSAFKEISAQDIASESKKETIVVMIGRQGCGYCAQFAPIIQSVGEAYGVTIRYIDFLKMVSLSGNAAKIIDQEAYDTIRTLKGATDELADAGATALEGTPATLIIKNNKIVNYIRGAAGAEVVAQAFDDAGLGK